MKPIIDEQQNKKPVKLDLQEQGNSIYLCAVDEENKVVANLLDFKENRIVSCANAKIVLEEEGYDTTFTEWNEHEQLKLDYKV